MCVLFLPQSRVATSKNKAKRDLILVNEEIPLLNMLVVLKDKR